jgi:hypothetical protein
MLVALRTFLLGVLPSGTPVYKTQVNRVAEPADDNFVMMTPINRLRLATNEDTYDDCQFVASVDALVMTVSSVAFGAVTPGRALFGPDVVAGTLIGTQISGGAGGPGTYAVSASQTIASQKMAAGVQNLKESTEVTVQLDFYGSTASDNAQTVSTLFRDDYAVSQFSAMSTGIAPLYADDPKQLPFIDEQKQYENRWVLMATMQVNPVVTVAQEFADQIQTTFIPVDNFYPAQGG